ncbi:hypothetical protein [Pseudomonas mandelii]|uniref:hypothetical protein n=1 Tax=Pseudomonas mandelii TaxID=75612 RepID=UPI0009EAE926|nr:hypothetical protein [Pseudomonas mandelii]
MSEFFKNLRARDGYNSETPADTREAAVAAALVLIHAKVSNSPERHTIVQEELQRLSSYADLIQQALKTD